MKIMMIIIMVMSSSFCRLTSVDSVAYFYLKATDNTTVPSKVRQQPKLYSDCDIFTSYTCVMLFISPLHFVGCFK